MPRSLPVPTRKRVGRVSLFEHHGTWWVYHRVLGKACRRKVGGAALAECEASLLNAQLVAAEAGLSLDTLLAERFQTQLVITSSAGTAAQSGQMGLPSNAAVASTGSAMSVGALRARFLAHHEHAFKSAVGTVARYASATLYLENFTRDQKIVDAAAVSAAAFVASLRSIEVSPNGHPNTARRRLADKGVRYIVECCRSLYRFGIDNGVLSPGTSNPFARARTVHVRIRDAKPIFVFDAEQELAFLTAARPWSFGVQFALAKTGLRPGELVHLLIEDIDLTGGWLLVRGKPELGWTTKTATDRRVPLLPELVAVLRTLINGRREGVLFLRERFAIQQSPPPQLSGGRAELAAAARRRLLAARERAGRTLTRREEARVYEQVWQDAGAIPVDRVRTSFIRAARAAGIAGATCPKSWRHTFATLLQQANVDLLVRQETLGHKPAGAGRSALGMTGTYTHTTPQFQRQEIERALRLRPAPLALTIHPVNGPAGP
jgi:integrase